ncbi:Clavaminate synthase-like protein [Lindgomyces ingoldianus]|uniref:Clavaminate synthase-like protein n=1 Tax=Lindgomyces ingoldianus TaxID=673940 RepID=A0ACB6QCV2_9PLEO|nr:Clavaminate synthase-like protein [Lindgomyces ingoldianus]KAF2464202.1 Clavaminate synthase-like protein [Lindgomyces ingoldianus]
MTEQVPIISLAGYYRTGLHSSEGQSIIQTIATAASTWGFFLITDTEVSPKIQSSLLSTSQAFFDLPLCIKEALDVRAGGVAWRGYMPLGGEHTHGQIDWKEGLYVGPEHSDEHPFIGLPLHGKNQFPDQALPNMRQEVLQYVNEVIKLGKALTDMFSLSLGLDKEELRKRFLEPEPVVIFRCFKYAPIEGDAVNGPSGGEDGFGIGEHTDFGYLTILKVDSPGLQVLSPTDKWVDVPCVETSFVVNVGDMFDQLTWGRYRSRPHRVRRPISGSLPRYSFPLFFDFAWNAEMERLSLEHLSPLSENEKELAELRWAATTFREVKGRWSQYLARKVQKVFPNMGLPDFGPNAAPSTRFTREVVS